MDAIIKNENVYVVVINKEEREGINIKESEDLILCKPGKRQNWLYGGRVYLQYYGDYLQLRIDGIIIQDYKYYILDDELRLEKVAAFLNQIENLGVDSFLENYKIQLQELKKEVESMIESMQQDLAVKYDENKAKRLYSLQEFVSQIVFVVFSILINMNAGLSNQDYTNAYDTIINMYF